MYLIKLLPYLERQKKPQPGEPPVLGWQAPRQQENQKCLLHTVCVFQDESGGVLPLGKGQGELILCSVCT